MTKSSKSASADSATGAETPIQFVKGVGPRLASVFEARGISTVRDVLSFFPRAYEDRSKLLSVSQLVEGIKATVPVRVISARRIPTRNRQMFEVRTADESGAQLVLKWFHLPRGMEQRFAPGTQIIVTGTPKIFMGRPEFAHPEITWNMGADAAATESSADVGRVVPVYVEIEGVPSRTLRKVLWEALEKYASTLMEDLPERLREKHGLPSLAQAVRNIHFPPDSGDKDLTDLVEFDTPSHWRLIYEEFLKFEYLVLLRKRTMGREKAPAIGPRGAAVAAELTRALPFTLTGHQTLAVAEVMADFAKPHPMNRLVQGDVGSGKTAVAFVTAGAALAEGGQATLMAPTEILAEQHYKNAIKLFGGRLNVALLTGKTPASERGKLLPRLASGEPILLIGTHALIEDPVKFANLTYVMIDEQHRFGVDQRRALRLKGTRPDADAPGRLVFPHSLVMTATPIPRTLALTAYGDLAVTSITELPPGRSPVRTHVVREARHRDRAYEVIRGELAKGHQAYFIYPLVHESEAEGFTTLKSAVNETERLQDEVFTEYKVGLLHGQMKADEKGAIMDRFKRGELHVLVSTTVVEVGVDVPNATIMVVEHSERFGLSQLHQLRGRVGRGAAQSWCFLFANQTTGEATSTRLEVLEETTDGFKIAEADLQIRGPGEFLGTRQAGALPFKLADLVRDKDWLFKAREDATAILENDPELKDPSNIPLRKYFDREGKAQSERLKTS